ncbi:hypothetical protein M409DRAFT_17121 [Zasmidium cellare ATCC 36951]|uniref:Uncharacterized protein n=1 Tax=Zasmidium cellare ATCC 36951 TaxID=1080233 RepID=A0A6A6D1Y0_ZASCE|nr:uncharacterized protein M409DRAFT_17121 [Zasmidium cellare ATCC 36951]KAF2173175.1 hypothetical protein M409DRAFT_17121 [Zasmidium cellare ATCC 36951]
MPPRIHLQPQQLRPSSSTQYVCRQCRNASVASATTPAPPIEQTIHAAAPIARYPPTQPPSYKSPEFRKTQLHRQYQSLLRSTQLMLVFQHNNLKSTEWMGIRRELATALRKVDEELAKNGDQDSLSSDVKLQVVQTGIFVSALKVVEFWDPKFEPKIPEQDPTDPKTASSAVIPNTKPSKHDKMIQHGLSKKAHAIAVHRAKYMRHGLEPLLSGPLALLTLPTVSPQHLKAALSILSPSKDFPAPKRKTNPGYHEPAVQNGIQKLMLLGARVEGKAFDMEGAKWVGSIEGGLDGLRGQMVAMLQSVGAGITNTLEAASKSLYLTVEGRRTMLEDEEKGIPEEKGESETKTEGS